MSYPGSTPDGQYPVGGQPAYQPAQPNPYQQAPDPGPAGYPYQQPPAPASGPPAPVYPASGPPAQSYPASGPPAQGFPASGPPAQAYGQPTSGYPAADSYGVAPTQALPGGNPAAAPTSYQPGAAPLPAYDPNAPVSAPGYDQYQPPVSVGPPGAYQQAPAPAPRKSPATLLLGIAAVVFFLATAVLAPLYVVKSNDAAKTSKSQRAEIASKSSQLANAQKQLKDKETELSSAKSKQTDTDAQLAEVKKEKDAIADCLNLFVEVQTAVNRKDTATYNRLYPQLVSACDEADKYLN